MPAGQVRRSHCSVAEKAKRDAVRCSRGRIRPPAARRSWRKPPVRYVASMSRNRLTKPSNSDRIYQEHRKVGRRWGQLSSTDDCRTALRRENESRPARFGWTLSDDPYNKAGDPRKVTGSSQRSPLHAAGCRHFRKCALLAVTRSSVGAFSGGVPRALPHKSESGSARPADVREGTQNVNQHRTGTPSSPGYHLDSTSRIR
jgi:hypothetical protein